MKTSLRHLGAAVAVLGVALAMPPAPAQTSSCTEQPSGSFFCPGSGIAIGDAAPAAPYPSTIVVEGLAGTITDVEVGLIGLRHTNPDDLDLMVVAPDGTRLVALSDAGGHHDVDGNLVLDDQASQQAPDTTAFGSGTSIWRPTNYHDGQTDTFPAPAPQGDAAGSLATFNGIDPNGTWKLFVVDDEEQDTGSLESWSLVLDVQASSTLDPSESVDLIQQEAPPALLAIGKQPTDISQATTDRFLLKDPASEGRPQAPNEAGPYEESGLLAGKEWRVERGNWDGEETLEPTIDETDDGTAEPTPRIEGEELLVTTRDGRVHLLDDAHANADATTATGYALLHTFDPVSGGFGPAVGATFVDREASMADHDSNPATPEIWTSDGEEEIAILVENDDAASTRYSLLWYPDGGDVAGLATSPEIEPVQLDGDIPPEDDPTLTMHSLTRAAGASGTFLIAFSYATTTTTIARVAYRSESSCVSALCHFRITGTARDIRAEGFRDVVAAVACDPPDDGVCDEGVLTMHTLPDTGTPGFGLDDFQGEIGNADFAAQTEVPPGRCSVPRRERASVALLGSGAANLSAGVGGCVTVVEDGDVDRISAHLASVDSWHTISLGSVKGDVHLPALHLMVRDHDLTGAAVTSPEILVQVTFVERRDGVDRLRVVGARIDPDLVSPWNNPIRTPSFQIGPASDAQGTAPCEGPNTAGCYVATPVELQYLRTRLEPVTTAPASMTSRSTTSETIVESLPMPVVLVSAPPHIRGLGQQANPPVFVTGRSFGVGSGESYSSSTSLILGLDLSFNLLVTEVGVDVESRLTWSSGYNKSEHHSTTIEDLYLGSTSDSTVVVQRDSFYQRSFTVLESTDGLGVGSLLTAMYPRETVLQIRGADQARSQLAGVLPSEVWDAALPTDTGDPRTFLSRSEVGAYCDSPPVFSGQHTVGEGVAASEGARITLDETETTEEFTEFAWSLEGTATAAIVRAGVGGGRTSGRSWSHTLGTRTGFEGYVGHIPEDIPDSDESYSWGLFACKKFLVDHPVWTQGFWVDGYAGHGPYEEVVEPTVEGPFDGDDTTTTPTFTWGGGEHVHHYEIELECLSCDDDRTYPSIDGDQTSFTVPDPLQAGERYRWRLITVGFDGQRIVSQWFSFTAWGEATGTIQLLTPLVNADRSVSLDWIPPDGAAGWLYEVTVTPAGGADPAAASGSITETHWRSPADLPLGAYDVTVTGTTPIDPEGVSATRSFDVRNLLPHASFTFTPAAPSNLDVVHFADASSDDDGEIVAWSWDFDDGSSSTLEAPQHVFDQAGTYHVTLEATDDDGAVDTRTRKVTVSLHPESQQALDQAKRCPGLEDLPGTHVVGSEQNDILVGTEGPDVVCGLGGGDELRGLDGDDVLLGGRGRDLLSGDSGDDRLVQGPGGGRAFGKDGDDVLRGGSGRDLLVGGPGRDRLAGRGGRDEMLGSSSDDVLRGGAGRDLLYGGPGNRDRCSGGIGRNVVRACERGKG